MDCTGYRALIDALLEIPRRTILIQTAPIFKNPSIPSLVVSLPRCEGEMGREEEERTYIQILVL